MANISGGYIKLSRSILEWQWADCPNTLALWVHILLGANWEDKKWHGESVGRGSLITSLAELSIDTGISVRSVRTSLSRLVDSEAITLKTTSKWTKITVCNYDTYQSNVDDCRQTNDKQATSKRQTADKQTTTTKEYKEEKEYQEDKKEKERDTDVSPKKVPIDFVFVKCLWNDSMKGKVPKIQALSESRKEKIKLRVAEMGGWAEAEKILPECFKKINESDFCNGENDNKWVATFDWFFTNDKNWIKVSEGNYDNRQRKTQLDILAENIKKADAYYEQRYRGYGGASPYGNQTGGGPYGPDEQ